MTDDPHDDDGIEYDLSARGSEVTYDIDDAELPSQAVVRAVASVTNRSVLDLNPLYDVIDPGHLDGLFEDAGENSAFEERSVTFDFNECRVTLTPTEVRVRRYDDGSS